MRYFNPIGAHPSIEIGTTRWSATKLSSVYNKQQRDFETLVYGNDYLTADGTCIRDYIHVVDLAKAHVVALQRLKNRNNLEKSKL
jgi:UDP-glucose 4-epimerase